MPHSSDVVSSFRPSELEREIIDIIPEGNASRISTADIRLTLANRGYKRTARAVQKSLDDLALHYLALEKKVHGKAYFWRWKAKRPALGPDLRPHQAVGLAIAAAQSRHLLPPATLKWLESRFDATQAELQKDPSGRVVSWLEKVRRVPHDLPREPPPVLDEVFFAVATALYDELRLRIEYRKRGSEELDTYELHPVGLIERGGELWLLARKVVDDVVGATRTFLLHRMADAEVIPGSVAKSPGKAAFERAIEEGLAHFPLALGSKVPLVARFHAEVVERLLESPIAKDQKVSLVDDEWHELRATVADTRALRAFLVSYGPYCEVREPKELRDDVARTLREGAKLYAKR